MQADRPMKLASKPACSFFCFLPMRDSLRLLPALELSAALMDDFFTRPLTRFPMFVDVHDVRTKKERVTR